MPIAFRPRQLRACPGKRVGLWRKAAAGGGPPVAGWGQALVRTTNPECPGPALHCNHAGRHVGRTGAGDLRRTRSQARIGSRVAPGIAAVGVRDHVANRLRQATQRKASSPLKNAVVAFFNLAKCKAKLRTEAQNNDLRRNFVIASVRCHSPSNSSTGCYTSSFPSGHSTMATGGARHQCNSTMRLAGNGARRHWWLPPPDTYASLRKLFLSHS